MKFFEKEIQLAAAEKYWLNVFVFVFGSSLHMVLNDSNQNLNQTSQIAEKPVAAPHLPSIPVRPGSGGARRAKCKMQIRMKYKYKYRFWAETQIQKYKYAFRHFGGGHLSP